MEEERETEEVEEDARQESTLDSVTQVAEVVIPIQEGEEEIEICEIPRTRPVEAETPDCETEPLVTVHSELPADAGDHDAETRTGSEIQPDTNDTVSRCLHNIIVRNHGRGRYKLYPTRFDLHNDFTKLKAIPATMIALKAML